MSSSFYFGSLDFIVQVEVYQVTVSVPTFGSDRLTVVKKVRDSPQVTYKLYVQSVDIKDVL